MLRKIIIFLIALTPWGRAYLVARKGISVARQGAQTIRATRKGPQISAGPRDYYNLTKPGIIRGNLLTATAGYFLATGLDVSFTTLFGMLLGLSLVIASGCVVNNYIDRGIDRLMDRTKKRSLVVGGISNFRALTFAGVLGVLGIISLLTLTTFMATLIALFGWFAYVIIYGIAKRKSVHGTLIGSISGSVPPVVGYTAVTGQVDTAALLLFTILVSWQMPHFYAIAMYRAKDYASASIPVLPVVKGMRATKVQIIAYIFSFIVASSLLTVYGYTGWIYLATTTVLGLIWLGIGLRSFNTLSDEKWGKQMFLFSLIVILVLSLIIPVGALLP